MTAGETKLLLDSLDEIEQRATAGIKTLQTVQQMCYSTKEYLARVAGPAPSGETPHERQRRQIIENYRNRMQKKLMATINTSHNAGK